MKIRATSYFVNALKKNLTLLGVLNPDIFKAGNEAQLEEIKEFAEGIPIDEVLLKEMEFLDDMSQAWLGSSLWDPKDPHAVLGAKLYQLTIFSTLLSSSWSINSFDAPDYPFVEFLSPDIVAMIIYMPHLGKGVPPRNDTQYLILCLKKEGRAEIWLDLYFPPKPSFLKWKGTWGGAYTILYRMFLKARIQEHIMTFETDLLRIET